MEIEIGISIGEDKTIDSINFQKTREVKIKGS